MIIHWHLDSFVDAEKLQTNSRSSVSLFVAPAVAVVGFLILVVVAVALVAAFVRRQKSASK